MAVAWAGTEAWACTVVWGEWGWAHTWASAGLGLACTGAWVEVVWPVAWACRAALVEVVLACKPAGALAGALVVEACRLAWLVVEV